MAELQAALAALSGKSGGIPDAASTPKPLTPSTLGAQASWHVPPHLLRQPAIRAVAFAAHDASREACSSPDDFDRVYRYGLSLQVGISLLVGEALRPRAHKGACHLSSQGNCRGPRQKPKHSCCLLSDSCCLLSHPPQELASKLTQQPADQLALLHQVGGWGALQRLSGR